MAQKTIAKCRSNNQPFSVLFFDLDGFKKVNDELGHDSGDKVLRRFGLFLEERVGASSIVLHWASGDEFVVILPGLDGEGAIEVSLELLSAGRDFDFDSQGKAIGFSIGIASGSDIESEGSLGALLEAADNALMNEAKKDGKGIARFFSDVSFPGDSSKTAIGQAVCLMKSSLGRQSPKAFASPWLNTLSLAVSRLCRDPEWRSKINDEAQRFLEHTKLRIDDSVLLCQHEFGAKMETAPAASRLDLALAIATGILHAEAHKVITPPGAQLTAKVTATAISLDCDLNDTLWSENLAGETPAIGEVELGGPWLLEEPDTSDEGTARVAILVQIGHGTTDVPSSLVAESVFVDDRPTGGGGLPDFWELTVAHVLEALKAHPNATEILVLGSAQFGAKSIKYLSHADKWNNRLIEEKTNLSLEIVEAGQARLLGNVHVASSKDEVIEILTKAVQGPRDLMPDPAHVPGEQRNRIITREIDQATRNEIGLKLQDGIRLPSLAQAYPTVLEILRTNPIPENEIIDQAGQPLRELRDFKVELTDPEREMIPFFYLKEEAALEEYYQREYKAENGKFGLEFRRNDQRERVLAHVLSAITANNEFSTRRAIVIVPHEATDGELTPLGLVAVRCAPRFAGPLATLHFSFVWRTVEALVGFPYSLYGSVRFAQDFVDDVRGRLGGTRPCELGTVTYLALSLHMFLDDTSLNIARRIVNDASK